MANSRIFVGNLPMDIKESEVDDLFYKYGRITNIEIKRKDRPPAFCFITFEDPRDADDAIYGRDGYRFDKERLRVEMSSAGGRNRGDRFADRGGDRRDSGRDAGRRSDTPYPSRNAGGEGGPKRSEYRVLISNLPRSASWQDLKDFGRQAGDVLHGDVDRNGNGVLEYRDEQGMEEAIRQLDDTKFENRVDTAYVRVKRDPSAGGRSTGAGRSNGDRGRGSSDRSPSPRGRSPSPRKRSPSVDSRDDFRRRSPSGGRSPRSDRSRSPSPADRHRSPTRSRSPSPAPAAAAADNA